jgi:hypothetical protein
VARRAVAIGGLALRSIFGQERGGGHTAFLAPRAGRGRHGTGENQTRCGEAAFPQAQTCSSEQGGQRRSWRRAHAKSRGRLSCSAWARRSWRGASIEDSRQPLPTYGATSIPSKHAPITAARDGKSPVPGRDPRALARDRAGPRELRSSRPHRGKDSFEDGCCRGTGTRPRRT